MAMIDCPECGKQISDKAPACPNCGAPSNLFQPQQSPPPPPTAPSKNSTTKNRTAQVVILLVLCLGLFGLWRSILSNKAAPPGAGLIGIVRQPVKVVDQRVQLKEGQAVTYSLNLNTDSRVQVQVTAAPKPVDVMLMDQNQAAQFRQAMGKLFGGNYTYMQALSGQQVLSMDKTDLLPRGQWALVVMRPREAILFTEDAAAQIVVTVY